MTLERTISVETASTLMKLLLDRTTLLNETSPDDDNLKKSGNHVIPTSFGSYLTIGRMELKIAKILESAGGRLSVGDLMGLLGVSDGHAVHFALRHLELFQCEEQVMTEAYLSREVHEIVAYMQVCSDGMLAVAEISQQLNLSMVSTVQILERRLPVTITLQTLSNGSKAIVSDDYLLKHQFIAHGALLAATSPIQLTNLALHCRCEPGWLRDLIVPRIIHVLPGELHGETYIPLAYTTTKRRIAEEFFHTNGYITVDQGRKFGVSPALLKQYVTETYPSALVLHDCFLDGDTLLPLLEGLVQEASTNQSWVDLSQHIAPELLMHDDVCRTLLTELVLSKDAEGTGLVVLTKDSALFMSQPMIQALLETSVVPLIEPWATRRAREIEASGTASSAPPIASSHELKKSKRVSRKNAESKMVDGPAADSFIPFEEIVQAVLAGQPELSELHHVETGEGSALLQLCREAFWANNLLHSMCDRSVQAELKRLELERAAKVTINRKEAASKEVNVQVSFEDLSCFPTACYMIQGFAAFLEYATDARDNDKIILMEDALNELKRDFLLGCAADFTRRITLFCLFRNEEDDQIFTFETSESCERTNLPHYCSPANLATRQYQPICMSCRNSDDEPNQQGPLAMLRSILPTNVGTTLARQWILCGPECYQGNGIKPGSFEGFLTHIEEHCLTICGLPFKKLDKKAKKQFLNARRQCLVQKLEDETDPNAILQYAIMLLFQLVKNQVVFGSHLPTSILQLLIKEKKITDDVSDALTTLASQLASGDAVDSALIKRVKAAALGRK